MISSSASNPAACRKPFTTPTRRTEPEPRTATAAMSAMALLLSPLYAPPLTTHAPTHPPRARARAHKERERDLWPSLLLSPTACLLSPLSLERGRGPLPSSTCAAFPQPTVLRSSSSSCPVSSATPLLGQAATQGGALATELPWYPCRIEIALLY